MKQVFYLLLGCTIIGLTSCRNKFTSDASGTFEAEEVVVSAEQTGKLISFSVNEGDKLEKNAVLGQIDVTTDKLKAEQVEASIQALHQKTNDPQEQVNLVKRQLNVQESQLAQLQRERTRIANLLKADAATQKQADDISSSIDQLNKQIEVTVSNSIYMSAISIHKTVVS
ncbi:hypothetical protein EMGBS15_09520 [Filimonas sp.]|nr:hypothetical protein EMGBS15_09520 [Filimonas sp.]